MSVNAISLRGVRKSYGEHRVLDGIDLDVATGTVFALLGPNGSGKSTTVNLMSTLIRPDAGTITIDGHDVTREAAAVRAAIGVTGQFSAVDDLLTGRENLRLMADLHHLRRGDARRRISELLEEFDLVEAAHRPASTYSGGMRRRLDLAMTLVVQPKILFLDEPTTGLDPRSRHRMWDCVRALVAGGITVFLTTQHLEEADVLADRIALLDHGRLVAEGTQRELKALVPTGHVEIEFDSPSALAAASLAVPHASVDDGALTLRVASDGSLGALRSLLAAIDGVGDGRVTMRHPDLDDVYFALTEVTR